MLIFRVLHSCWFGCSVFFDLPCWLNFHNLLVIFFFEAVCVWHSWLLMYLTDMVDQQPPIIWLGFPCHHVKYSHIPSLAPTDILWVVILAVIYGPWMAKNKPCWTLKIFLKYFLTLWLAKKHFFIFGNKKLSIASFSRSFFDAKLLGAG